MKRISRGLAAAAVLALVLSPGLAAAKAGAGSSMGSRGSNTYSAPPATRTAPSTAAPMERSVTQPSAPQPGYGAQQGFGGLAPRPSFMSGLMGGLIGAGIGGMLFGGGMFGGISGIGSVLGLLLQIGLAFLVVRLIMGFFAQRRPAMAGGPQMFTPTGVNPQAAWSQHDLGTMSRITTPEMNSYFAEQLADQASRNIRNQVSAVKLEQGDLSEAWTEQGRDYATVAMRFSMIDVTVAPNGKVVDGHPSERTMTTEIWTFLRARGGDWVLSAIQQVR